MNAATSYVVNAVLEHEQLSKLPGEFLARARAAEPETLMAAKRASRELASQLVHSVHSGFDLAVQDTPAGHLARDLAQLACATSIDWDQAAEHLVAGALDRELRAPLLADQRRTTLPDHPDDARQLGEAPPV